MMSTIPRYTAAARKVFDSNQTGESFESASGKALSVGYLAMNFNGVIFVYYDYGKIWVETPFKVVDFQF